MSMTPDEIIQQLPEFLRNSSTYSLIITDLEGKYIYVNELFDQRFSFLNSHFVGEHISVAIHPDDIAKCTEVVEQCFKYPNKSFPIEIRKPSNLNKEYHYTYWDFSLFKDKNGVPAGILCLGHDITEAQVVNQKLRLSEYKLRAILDSTSDNNVLISSDYKVLSFNKQASIVSELVFGKPLFENANMWDYVLPADQSDFLADTQKVLQGERLSFEREIFFGETSAWIEVNYNPVYDSTSGLIMGFSFNSTDISLRKQNELKIINQNERLKQISWQQSHEVRRHMVNMMGLYKLIKDSNVLTEAEKIEKLDLLLNETKELDQIIHSIVAQSIEKQS